MNRIKRHLLSYKYAARGIWLALALDQNMRIHAMVTIAVVFMNYFLDISRIDWIVSLMLIGLVWMAEIFNTAIERLADRVSQERHVLIAQAKDMAAGAVLIICVFAAICAIFIYSPYLL
jgi:diacylglycerol kinase